MFPEINVGLVNSMRTRFSDILNSGITGDPVYLVSSFLDPATFEYLPNEFNLECLAQAEIKTMVIKCLLVYKC